MGIKQRNRKPWSYNLGMVEAINRAGNQTKLAEMLGISQCRVSQLLRRQVTLKYVEKLSAITGVPRGMFRPDVWGHELDPELCKVVVRGVVHRPDLYPSRAA